MAEEILTVSEESLKKEKGLTSYGLKWIAIICMFIDHFAAIIIERYMTSIPDFQADFSNPLFLVYFLLRGIGRISFPLFIFLMIQGFTHTKSKAKYALRLALFALISEVPFDLGFNASIWDMSYQNVFLTLTLGFLFMWFSDYIYTKALKPWLCYLGIVLGSLFMGGYLGILFINIFYSYGVDLTSVIGIISSIAGASALCAILLVAVNIKKSFTEVGQAAFSLMALAALMFVADLLRTDYGAFGVMAIAVAYICRASKKKTLGFAMIPLVLSSALEAVAFIDMIPVAKYNGKRGKSMKYFFYAFYPCHILLISLIAHFMGL